MYFFLPSPEKNSWQTQTFPECGGAIDIAHQRRRHRRRAERRANSARILESDALTTWFQACCNVAAQHLWRHLFWSTASWRKVLDSFIKGAQKEGLTDSPTPPLSASPIGRKHPRECCLYRLVPCVLQCCNSTPLATPLLIYGILKESGCAGFFQ